MNHIDQGTNLSATRPDSSEARAGAFLAPACRRVLSGLVLSAGIGLAGPTMGAELKTLAEARNVNANTVGVVFHYEDNYRKLIDDLAIELARNADIRMVPVIGLNHLQSIYDQLYMHGIDLSVVHSDIFEYLSMTQGYERVYQRINSLVELFQEPIAIVASDEYDSIEDLTGKTVNFGKPGKGSDITGTVLFSKLGIEVKPTRFDKLDALEKVKSGEIAAMVYLAEDVVEEFSEVTAEDGVTLLALPTSNDLLSYYSKTTLDKRLFEGLLGDDKTVDSLAVSVIIASYNWPASETERYAKLRRFVEGFVGSLDDLKQGDYQDTWDEVSLDREVPGVPTLALVDTVAREQALERQRLAEAEAAERAAELKAEQERLTAQLADRLGDRISDADDPEELQKLISQLQAILEETGEAGESDE